MMFYEADVFVEFSDFFGDELFVERCVCGLLFLRRLVHGVRESLPWKREEIDGERSIA